MKFSTKNMVLKHEFPGIDIYEAEGKDKHSIDWALVKIKDGVTPLKLIRGSHEIIYVIKGEYELAINGKKEVIKEGECYILEPGIPHKGRAKYAEMFVACNPPLDVRNIEFLDESDANI